MSYFLTPGIDNRLRMLRRKRQGLQRSLSALIASHRDTTSRYCGYNWWDDGADHFWLARFIDLHLQPRTRVNFFSCFREPLSLIRYYKGKKIFFSGENLQPSRVFYTHERMLQHRVDEVDLALGFEFRSEPNYYRFPLWICHHDFIRPEDGLPEIQAKIDQLNAPSLRLSAGRDRFIGQISSHDNGGLRGELIDLLSPIGQIDCAGKFRNNTDELLRVYEDRKELFLSRYRFNICPENSLGEGYTTEKIFDSITAGCIPIYWGSYLEPDILNPKAILRYERGQEQALYDRVQELWTSTSAYEEFAQEPPFVAGAAERIWETIEGLKEHLRLVLEGER